MNFYFYQSAFYERHVNTLLPQKHYQIKNCHWSVKYRSGYFHSHDLIFFNHKHLQLQVNLLRMLIYLENTSSRSKTKVLKQIFLKNLSEPSCVLTTGRKIRFMLFNFLYRLFSNVFTYFKIMNFGQQSLLRMTISLHLHRVPIWSCCPIGQYIIFYYFPYDRTINDERKVI